MNTLANTFSSWCGGFNMGHIGGYSIFNILLLIGIVVLIYVLIRKNWTKNDKSSGSDDALQLLKKRLARGEISTEEYKDMKDTLENN